MDSASYERFNEHMEQTHKRNFGRKRTRIMEAVSVLARSYEKALRFRKKEDNGKLGRSVDRLARIESNVPYIVRDCITVIMNKMTRAAM